MGLLRVPSNSSVPEYLNSMPRLGILLMGHVSACVCVRRHYVSTYVKEQHKAKYLFSEGTLQAVAYTSTLLYDELTYTEQNGKVRRETEESPEIRR
jgi:hypothetical protein